MRQIKDYRREHCKAVLAERINKKEQKIRNKVAAVDARTGDKAESTKDDQEDVIKAQDQAHSG
tara:strand:- start:251 stop:439 length:189 start_codon:yes stop_codon:yes gene_type:complete